jgi:tetratricopeptide (TPR) repeat protein
MSLERRRSTDFGLPRLGVLLTLIAGLGWAGEANAQGFRWPENPENLKVLPDSIRGSSLGQIMRGFTMSLGVRCSHCHVGEEGQDLTTYDFPADDKEPKRIARVMIEMVQTINGTHLAELDQFDRSGRVEVTCITCHRSQKQPRLIEDLVAEKIDEAGLEAAITMYREMRERYYGGFSYDFGDGPLTRLGEELAGDGKLEEAVAILELALEYYPELPLVYITYAGVLAQANRNDDAISALEKALEYAPEGWHPFIERQLAGLREQ